MSALLPPARMVAPAQTRLMRIPVAVSLDMKGRNVKQVGQIIINSTMHMGFGNLNMKLSFETCDIIHILYNHMLGRCTM